MAGRYLRDNDYRLHNGGSSARGHIHDLRASGTNTFRNKLHEPKAGASIAVVSQTFCCATYLRGYDSIGSDTGLQVTLTPGTTAVGFDLFTIVSGNANGTNQDMVDVTVAGQKYTVTTAMAPHTVFVGFVSAKPIPSVTITTGVTQVDAINFSFNTGARITAGGVVSAGLSTPA